MRTPEGSEQIEPFDVPIHLETTAESISYEGEGHTIYAQGVTCVDDTVDAYFIDGTVPTEDPNC